MKNKIIAFYIIFALVCSNFTFAENQNQENLAILENGVKKTFRISAYYSPLPGQKKYLRGNYAAEIRLNGNGTNGADGTEVYHGMIAAPKNYPFGTKIFIPGFGIRTVHDRGGAIVNAGQRGQQHDRIDIWMGYGDEGLEKALAWGMRTIEGIVLPNETLENVNFYWLNSAVIVKNSTMEFGSSGNSVKLLQQNLKNLGFFSEEITGFFGNETKKSLIEFQIAHHIISSENETGAGIFGPKTSRKLSQQIAQNKISNTDSKNQFDPFFSKKIAFGEKNDSVKLLQQNLKNLGFFSEEITGFFGNETKKSLIEFQIAHHIISSENETGAGIFGPKTKKEFVVIFTDREKILTKKNTEKIVVENFSQNLKVAKQ